MSDRNTAIPASYVIFEREGKILFSRRSNTGYRDGFYQMPAGHVDAGESPAQAAIREMVEEVGVTILPEDLEFIHIGYRLSEDKTMNRVDFFFKTLKWSGEITNMEPEKCDDMIWVEYENLPENTVPFIKDVIKAITEGRILSESV